MVIVRKITIIVSFFHVDGQILKSHVVLLLSTPPPPLIDVKGVRHRFLCPLDEGSPLQSELCVEYVCLCGSVWPMCHSSDGCSPASNLFLLYLGRVRHGTLGSVV